MLSAEQIMTTDVVTITPDASIKDAIELLISRRVSGLPVVDNSGALVGILTEFALLGLAYDSNIQNDTVQSHMTRETMTVDAKDCVNKIADLCIVHRIHRLPVLDRGRLVGLVSRGDILRALYEAKAPVGAC